MHISINSNTLYVFNGDKQLYESYVENIMQSDKYIVILGSIDDCKILISHVTGYMYMNIKYMLRRQRVLV